MRNYLFLILMFGFSSWLSAYEAEYDSLRRKADVLYMKGKTDTAYWLYEGLLKEGLKDARLFANMGNAAFSLNKTAEAIAWYRQSLSMDPDNKVAANNLKFALRKLELEDEEAKIQGNWWCSPLIILALCWVSAGFLTLCLYSQNRKVAIISGMVAVILLLTVAMFSIKEVFLKNKQSGVLLTDAKVYQLPSELSDEVYEFSAGTLISITKRESNWYQVRLGKNKRGWVRRSMILAIR